jgi:hypothetical protein
MKDKFKKVVALVPKGEHFDPSVLSNTDGTFLTPAHLEAIEAEFTLNETNHLASVQNVANLTNQLSAMTTARNSATESLTTAQGEVVRLTVALVEANKKPASEFTPTPVLGDGVVVAPGASTGKDKYMQNSIEQGWVKKPVATT